MTDSREKEKLNFFFYFFKSELQKWSDVNAGTTAPAHDQPSGEQHDKLVRLPDMRF